MSLSLKRPFIGFLIRWILFRSHLFILDSTIRTHFFLLSAMCGSGDVSKFIDRCSMTDIHLSCSCAYVMGGKRAQIKIGNVCWQRHKNTHLRTQQSVMWECVCVLYQTIHPNHSSISNGIRDKIHLYRLWHNLSYVFIYIDVLIHRISIFEHVEITMMLQISSCAWDFLPPMYCIAMSVCACVCTSYQRRWFLFEFIWLEEIMLLLWNYIQKGWIFSHLIKLF